jgi:hypothetical protein
VRGRYEVAGFARRMLQTLNKPRNSTKPGWKECELGELENKLKEEYSEVMLEIARLRMALYSGEPIKEHAVLEIRERLAEEATDLGCVSMMLTDIVGGLDD